MVPNQSIKKWRQKRYEFLQDQEWYISILKKYKNLICEQKKVHDLNFPGKTFIKQWPEDWYDKAILGNLKNDIYNDLIKELKINSARFSKILDDLQADLVWFTEVVRLSSGESFGEKAILDDAKRAATVTCVENCYFAVICQHNYKKILQRLEKK